MASATELARSHYIKKIQAIKRHMKAETLIMNG